VVLFGFVVEVTITDPGAGYVTAPSVSITGGGGSGAVAVATITNGAVNDIVVLETGSGYTNRPSVVISPPPQALTLGVRLAPVLTVRGEPYSVAMIRAMVRCDRRGGGEAFLPGRGGSRSIEPRSQPVGLDSARQVPDGQPQYGTGPLAR
jgi:hypothetical protein